MDNLPPQPRRLDRVAFREIASPTVTISLRGKDGETTRWNTYNCSACLRPVYHQNYHWLKRVVVWKHCPAFGHGLECLYTGSFRTATQFDADDDSVTEPRGPKISPYKILMHQDCFHQLIKCLASQPKTLSLSNYLESILMQKPLASIDLPSTELAKHKAEATKLGLMLKERVENLQCLRIDEHELSNPYKVSQPICKGKSELSHARFRPCGQLSRLPAEILDSVMDLLSPQDFLNVRSTCSSLHHFPFATRCWRRALDSQYPNFEWEEVNDWKYVYEHRLGEDMRNVSRALVQVDQISKWVGRS